MATDHAAASQTHFARRATGFVRDVKVSDAVIFNVLPACPGLVMAVSIFWVLTAFSGVNVYACIVITAICSFLISGAFGLLSQIMPRSGADYILISRSLHPALAVGSSILIGASSMLAMGYWGVFTAKICIGPMLTMVGVAADSSTLQSWGGTIASKPWDMLVGFGEIALLALIMAYGMRFMMRVQFWLFATPIAYPSSLLPAQWRVLYAVNPMSGVVEGFRWALLGTNTAPGLMVAVSAITAIVVLVAGAFYFRRVERTFADLV